LPVSEWKTAAFRGLQRQHPDGKEVAILRGICQHVTVEKRGGILEMYKLEIPACLQLQVAVAPGRRLARGFSSCNMFQEPDDRLR